MREKLIFVFIFLCAGIFALDLPAQNYSAGFIERLQDSELKSKGSKRVFRNDSLKAIVFPVGGFGAGTINMDGYADRCGWQICENFSFYPSENSFFAMTVKPSGKTATTKALQYKDVGPFKGMKNIEFSGQFPFAEYKMTDKDAPVEVVYEAFNPFIPMDLKNSSIPVNIYKFTFKNTGTAAVDISVLATQQNFVSTLGMKPTQNLPAYSLIEDFEKDSIIGSIKYGNAFDGEPSEPTAKQKYYFGSMGSKVINSSSAHSETATGTMLLPEFTIDSNYIYFMAAGALSVDYAGIKLHIEDGTILTATGNNSELFEWVCWDVRKYSGKKAFIEIYDNMVGTFGFIKIDHIIQTNEKFNIYKYFEGTETKNQIVNIGKYSGLSLQSRRKETSLYYGSMFLYSPDEKSELTAAWDNLDTLYKQFSSSGKVPRVEEYSTGGRECPVKGAVVTPISLAPGESKSVYFVLTWFFPNIRHGNAVWNFVGNHYCNLWSEAENVAKYVDSNFNYLELETRKFNSVLYSSNLPNWLLDRLSSQLSVLKTKTFFWSGNDYIGGYEGLFENSGSCPGNCTHVYQYVQSSARLFPELARIMRSEMLESQNENGGIPFRHLLETRVATDGQCGEILSSFREYLLNKDTFWVNKYYQKIINAMDYVINTWDSDRDGMLYGEQHNTLDCELDGSSSWLGSLYLTALQAASELAKKMNDNTNYEKYRNLWGVGIKNQEEQLWNNDYYYELQSDRRRNDYLNACYIDQALGVWWANQLNLKSPYNTERVKKALQTIISNNYRNNYGSKYVFNRRFVVGDDDGLFLASWPKHDFSAPTIKYYDEIWSGLEYSAAATMIQNGMLDEGLTITKAVYDRYNGEYKEGVNFQAWGFTGNPFGDDECGKFYVRAMSNWSILLALQGFIYNAPEQIIGFKPVWQPENHLTFFSASDAWGLFSQKNDTNFQNDTIFVKYGNLEVKELIFQIPECADTTTLKITVRAEGKNLTYKYRIEQDSIIHILLDSVCTLLNQQSIAVNFQFSKRTSTIDPQKSLLIEPPIYPTPAENVLTVNNLNKVEINRIEIIDFMGKTVADYNYSGYSRYLLLNLDGFPSGLYFIRMWLGTSYFSSKFLIVK